MGLISRLKSIWSEATELRRRGLRLLRNRRGFPFLFEGDPFRSNPIGQLWLTPLGWFYVAWDGDFKLNERPIGPFRSDALAATHLQDFRNDVLEATSIGELVARANRTGSADSDDDDRPGPPPYRLLPALAS